MKTKKSIYAVLFLILSATTLNANCQSAEPDEKPAVSYKVTADIVSSYIWRGTIGSKDPSFQPTMAIMYGGLEVGVWGSTNFLGTYKEVDPYIAFTAKSLKFMLTDYNWTFANSSYFNYKKDETDHILEGTIAFLGTENFPVSLAINTMFYGADKKYNDSETSTEPKQNFSTYVELGYTAGHSYFFAGFTPSNGYYGAGYGQVDGFAVVNLGLTYSRDMKITPDFSIPIKGTFCVNPQAESVHFVIGITL
jgi:hypothetical protein